MLTKIYNKIVPMLIPQKHKKPKVYITKYNP